MREEVVSFRIKSETDFWAGILFGILGVFAIYLSRDYPRGTALAMGPGYFPTVIGIVLVAIGAALAVMSLRLEGEKIDRTINLKALLAISAGLVLFGWGIERIGFVPSLAGLIILGTLAGHDFRWKEALALLVVLVAGSWLVFVWALDLPFTLFGAS
jgi:hypothetical protein